MRPITHLVVHCTAGRQTQTATDIVAYHKKTLKWRNPGYHYIIEADGNIVQTLQDKDISNGVAGKNSHIINVAYIGGIDPTTGKAIDNRTGAQKNSLVMLLRELKSKYPRAKIVGHRDLASTDSNGNGIIDPWERVKECPCFDAINEYDKTLSLQ